MTNNLFEKVLIIPSWLSKDGPIGSFFREQAEVVSDRFDIKFLYGDEISLSLKNYHRFGRFFRPIIKSEDEVDYYFFTYPKIPLLSLFPALRLAIKKKFYQLHLQKIQKTEKWTPDIIHAQSTFDGGIIAHYLSHILKKPFLITEHNLFLMHNVKSIKRVAAIQALESASKTLVVSYDKARQILMHNIKIEPYVIGNMINEKYFYYKPFSPRNEFVITTVGHFSFLKDYATFFKTMKLVIDKSTKPIRINCIGFNGWGGDNSVEIQKMANSFDVNNIHFIGHIDRDKMNTYYWDADIFVLTSIAEGLPVSVLEALACGRPVYATRCGGVEDIINTTNGEIVPIQDYRLLSDKILKLINGNSQFDYAQISRSILNKFGEKSFGNNISQFYNGIEISKPI